MSDAPAVRARQRRRPDALHPERITRQDQGSQLAAGAEATVPDGHAAALAGGQQEVDDIRMPSIGGCYGPKNTLWVIPGRKKMLFSALITSAPKKRPITHRWCCLMFPFIAPSIARQVANRTNGTNRCVELMPNMALSGVRRWIRSEMNAVVTMSATNVMPSARCQAEPFRLKNKTDAPRTNAGTTVTTCACTTSGAWMSGSSVIEHEHA